MELVYKAYMNTPIGKKNGVVRANVDGGSIDGMIEILGRKQAFKGTVSADGSCRIEGEITTLLRTFSYTAKGNVDEESIRLLLDGDRNSYELIGKREKGV